QNPNVSGESDYQSPFPDYNIPLFGEGGFSTVLSAIIGVVLVFIIAFAAGKLLKRKE
ncbi:MAG: PDGLE domain-containing protein, partial [Methanobacteriaceae archaeon]